jgi:hypothetical protein
MIVVYQNWAIMAVGVENDVRCWTFDIGKTNYHGQNTIKHFGNTLFTERT